MADRWLPEYHVDARVADLFTRVIAGSYDSEHYKATEEERREMYAANKLKTARTQIADYVWLPIELLTVSPGCAGRINGNNRNRDRLHLPAACLYFLPK